MEAEKGEKEKLEADEKLNKIENELTATKTELQTLIIKLGEKEKENKEQQSNIKELTVEKEALKVEINSLKSEKEALEDTKTQLEKDNLAIKQSKEMAIAALQSELENDQNLALQKAIEAAEDMKKKLESTKSDIDEKSTPLLF